MKKKFRFFQVSSMANIFLKFFIDPFCNFEDVYDSSCVILKVDLSSQVGILALTWPARRLPIQPRNKQNLERKKILLGIFILTLILAGVGTVDFARNEKKVKTC